MKKVYQYILAIGILFSFILFSPSVQASDEVGFNIQAVLPDNQLNKSDSFFNLRMAPKQKETIEMVLNNTSAKEMTFEINVNQAYTNDQGFIDYTDKIVKTDKSLQYKIDDLMTYEKEVTVAADSSVKIPFHLSMPAEFYDGEILAGIQVVKKENEQLNKDSIKNSVGYVLGIRLTETDKEVKRQMNLLSVKPKALFGKPTIVATVQNPTMESYGHLKYDVKIIEKGKKATFYETTYDNDMQLAPNSSYPFAIELKDKALLDGDFILDLTVTDAKKNKWKFTKEFEVTSEQAKKINQLTIDKSTTLKMPIIIWVVLGVVIIGILVVLFFKLNKSSKDKL